MTRCLSLLTLIAGGCTAVTNQANVDFVPTNGSPRTMRSKPPEQVTITSVAPTRPFAEVGFLEGRALYYGHGPGEVVATMRASAARYGCDALMITGPNNDVSGFKGSHT